MSDTIAKKKCSIIQIDPIDENLCFEVGCTPYMAFSHNKHLIACYNVLKKNKNHTVLLWPVGSNSFLNIDFSENEFITRKLYLNLDDFNKKYSKILVFLGLYIDVLTDSTLSFFNLPIKEVVWYQSATHWLENANLFPKNYLHTVSLAAKNITAIVSPNERILELTLRFTSTGWR